MIKVEPCKGCGGVILVDDFMGLRVRCETTPLDAHTAGAALLAGRSLYRVTYLGGRPSSFGSASTAVLGALRGEPSERPMVVVQHRCGPGERASAIPLKPSTAPQRAQQVAEQQKVPAMPPKAPVAPSRPSSGPSTPSSTHGSAKNVASQASKGRNPTCDGCGRPMGDGTYASIELGDIMVWKHHVETCGN